VKVGARGSAALAFMAKDVQVSKNGRIVQIGVAGRVNGKKCVVWKRLFVSDDWRTVGMSEPLYRLSTSPLFTVSMLKCRSHHHHQCYIEAGSSDRTARGSAGIVSLLAAEYRCSSRSF